MYVNLVHAGTHKQQVSPQRSKDMVRGTVQQAEHTSMGPRVSQGKVMLRVHGIVHGNINGKLFNYIKTPENFKIN
jgi:hypothetical protein